MDKYGRTELILACTGSPYAGQINEVGRILIDNIASIDDVDSRGNTALHTAVVYGDKKLVKYLIDGGAKKDIRNGLGNTALELVKMNQRTELADLFMNPFNLLEAVWDNNICMVRYFLERGDDINQYEYGGATPLYIAAEFNFIDIVRLLLEYGARPDDKPWSEKDYVNHEYRLGPLYAACKFGHTQILKLLLEYGGNININNYFLRGSLLHMAVRNGRSGVVETLLKQKGIEIESRDMGGNTPLHLARNWWRGDKADMIKIVKMLLECGANTNARNAHRETPLYLATRSGKVDIIKLLLKHGANIGQKNDNGVTPIELALLNIRNRKEILKVFFKYLKSTNLPEWRPRHHSEYSVGYRSAMKTLVILAKAEV